MLKKILFISLILMGLLFSNISLGSVINYERYWERTLQEKGLAVETTDDIITATKDDSYFVRQIALKLLTARIKQDAIPYLKKALNDEYIRVRTVAAHQLVTLGNSSGLERMIQDFKGLIPDCNDPNFKETKTSKKTIRPDGLRTEKDPEQYWGLHVAKVLSELGDYRGYKLAVVSLESDFGATSRKAVEVLGQIAEASDDELAKQGLDPVTVLSSHAEKEKRNTVYKKIAMVAEKLKGEKGKRILEKAEKNPHQKEGDIKRVKSSLKKITKKDKTKDK